MGFTIAGFMQKSIFLSFPVRQIGKQIKSTRIARFFVKNLTQTFLTNPICKMSDENGAKMVRGYMLMFLYDDTVNWYLVWPQWFFGLISVDFFIHGDSQLVVLVVSYGHDGDFSKRTHGSPESARRHRFRVVPGNHGDSPVAPAEDKKCEDQNLDLLLSQQKSFQQQQYNADVEKFCWKNFQFKKIFIETRDWTTSGYRVTKRWFRAKFGSKCDVHIAI